MCGAGALGLVAVRRDLRIIAIEILTFQSKQLSLIKSHGLVHAMYNCKCIIEIETLTFQSKQLSLIKAMVLSAVLRAFAEKN